VATLALLGIYHNNVSACVITQLYCLDTGCITDLYVYTDGIITRQDVEDLDITKHCALCYIHKLLNIKHIA